MRSIVTVCLAAVSSIGGAAGHVLADTKAEIVSTAMIWNGANCNTDPDLIRFGDRWFLACLENKAWTGGKIRVVTSADGETWESAALIESPTPTRGLHTPTFTITPGGRLMLSAMGGLPYPENPVLNPSDSGLMKTIV